MLCRTCTHFKTALGRASVGRQARHTLQHPCSQPQRGMSTVINQAQMVIRRLDRQREKRAVAGRDRHADQRQMLAYTPRPTVRPLSRPAHTHTHLPTAASSLTTRRPTTQYQQQQQQRHSLGTSLPGSHRYLDEMQVSTWPGPAYTTSRTR